MDYNIPITGLYEVLPRKMADELWLLFGDTHQIYASNKTQLRSIVNGLILSLYASQTCIEIMVGECCCMPIYDFVGLQNKVILNVSVDEFDDKHPSDDFIDEIFSRLLEVIDRKQRLDDERFANEFEERLRTDPTLLKYANSC